MAIHQHDERDNNFNLLRLVFATLVILGHAYEMTYDGSEREPFSVFTHTGMSLGTAAVDGFFLISGFLILKSWMHGPRLGAYLSKRVLRIVPGYVTAALLSTVVVGLAATHSFQFFKHFGFRYPLSLLMLDSPITPSVFPGHHWDFVNGSLWTIKFEFRCYLLIPLAGLLGMFRRRWLWYLLTLAFLVLAFVPGAEDHLLWQRWELVLGNPSSLYRLTAVFLCGGCFYLLWNRIPRRPWLAVAATVVLLPLLFHQATVEPAIVLLGGYLMFYFAFLPIRALNAFKHASDLSYGIYLYGWPVETLWVWYVHTTPMITFLVSLAGTLPLAWLSWHWVERPALLLKPKGSVPLPDEKPGR